MEPLSFPKHYTAHDWVNKKSGPTAEWPVAKGAGERSRRKSIETNKVQALIRKMEREGRL